MLARHSGSGSLGCQMIPGKGRRVLAGARSDLEDWPLASAAARTSRIGSRLRKVAGAVGALIGGRRRLCHFFVIVGADRADLDPRLEEMPGLPGTTLDDVRSAAALLAGSIVRTPMPYSRLLSEQCRDAQLFLKMENLQYTASFKERGALVKLLSLSTDQRRRGVIAMSAGDPCPRRRPTTPRFSASRPPSSCRRQRRSVKIAHTRHFGAPGWSSPAPSGRSGQLAQADDLAFVHPYDDPLIIAGQGAVLETPTSMSW